MKAVECECSGDIGRLPGGGGGGGMPKLQSWGACRKNARTQVNISNINISKYADRYTYKLEGQAIWCR